MNYKLKIMNYDVPEGSFVGFMVKNSSFIILVLVSWLLVLTGCGLGSDTAGTGSGGTAIEVAGTVKTQSGDKAGNVVVTLYAKGYNPSLGTTSPDNSIVAVTDSDGEFVFQGLTDGSYNLVVVDGQDGSRLLLQNIEIVEGTTDDINDEELILKTPGVIRCLLLDKGAAASDVVYIPGTGVYTELKTTDVDNGSFVIPNVPVGQFSTIMYSGNSNTTSLNIATLPVTVMSGDTTVLSFYPAYKYAAAVTINTKATGAGLETNVLNFPLLVRLTSENFSFSQARQQGEELRFAKPSGQLLSHEIERWDTEGERAAVWVRLDSVYADTNRSYMIMYWGNAASNAGWESRDVFQYDEGFAGVWHLGEAKDTVTEGFADATTAPDRGTERGIIYDVRAVIGLGQVFDGSESYIDVQTSQKLDQAPGMTISFWCRSDLDSFDVNRGLFGRGNAGSMKTPYIYGLAGTNKIRMDFQSDKDTVMLESTAIKKDTWFYIAFSWDGQTITSYINGVAGSATTTSQGSTLKTSDGSNYFAFVEGMTPWDGMMDEIRSEKVGRSASWIKLCFETQKQNSSVVEIK
ncbi:MAG: DUF2341 domain-containing protein [Fibrobacteria bacterium]|nr:DUF2341 domain-containing protein [Fibrobacteria bacterium]